MNLNLESGLLAKIGAGVAGAAGVTGVGVGGCYAAGVFGRGAESGAQKINYKKLDETDWATVTTQKNNYGTQTIGDVYGRYLYAPYSTEKNKVKFQGEWDYKFQRFSNRKAETQRDHPLHSIFKNANVTVAYREKTQSAEQGITGLNQLCEHAYKQSASSVSFAGSNTSDKTYLGENLMSFCSPLGSKPSSMSGYQSEDSNSILSNHSSVLIKTEDANEKYFWEAQQKWFISLADQVKDAYFVEYIKQESNHGEDFLKVACKKAYNLPSDTEEATEEKPLVADVLKYCTFPGYMS